MAYKFFSQQLLSKNILNLSDVFPEKQNLAKETTNVSYDLGDIVLYLQDVTENFRFSDTKYVELDNAIQSIIDKYYKSINKMNPFRSDLDTMALAQLDAGTVPREAAVVKEGKIKGKGAAKAAKVVENKPLPAPAPEPAAAVVAEMTDEQRVEEWKNAIEVLEMLGDDLTEEQKEALETLKSLIED